MEMTSQSVSSHTRSDVNQKHHSQVGQFQVSHNETGSRRVRYVRDCQVSADVVNHLETVNTSMTHFYPLFSCVLAAV